MHHKYWKIIGRGADVWIVGCLLINFVDGVAKIKLSRVNKSPLGLFVDLIYITLFLFAVLLTTDLQKVVISSPKYIRFSRSLFFAIMAND